MYEQDASAASRQAGATKSQKHVKTLCFQVSGNPKKSSRSTQNTNETWILHAESAVAIITKKPSKIIPKWSEKTKKSTPRLLQAGPFGNFMRFKMMLNIKSSSRSPKRPPRGPQEKMLSNDPPKHLKDYFIQ